MEPSVQVHCVKMHQADSRAECGQRDAVSRPISLGPNKALQTPYWLHSAITATQWNKKLHNNEILKERTRITNIIVFLCLIQYENSKLVLKKVTFII